MPVFTPDKDERDTTAEEFPLGPLHDVEEDDYSEDSFPCS